VHRDRVHPIVEEPKTYSFLKPHEASDFPFVKSWASPYENLIMMERLATLEWAAKSSVLESASVRETFAVPRIVILNEVKDFARILRAPLLAYSLRLRRDSRMQPVLTRFASLKNIL